MKKIIIALAMIITVAAFSACQQKQPSPVQAEPKNEPATSEIPKNDTIKVNGSATIEKSEAKVDLIPSRDPAPNCKWVESKAGDELGIKLLMEKCPNTTIDEEKMIIAYSPVMRVFPDPLPWMIVFRKDKSQSPEMALQEQIINRLPTEERLNCEVKKDTTISRQDIEIYTIEPNAEYLEKQQAAGNYFGHCGIYGVTNGIQYFEFQKQNPLKFVFKLIGQDYPRFDAVYILPE